MNSSPFCPRCGSEISDGLCPHCGATGALSSETGVKPKGSRALRILLIAGAVYLAGSVTLLVIVGHFLMQKAKEREAWNRAHSDFSQSVGRAVSARHDGPVARVSELKGSGRIYLIQIGDHKAPYSLEDFALWLHSKYALDVQVLPGMAIDNSAWDPGRKQYVAELLYEQIKRMHPDLAANTNAHLIGFTDDDMHSIQNNWARSRTQRYWRDAVISTNQEISWYNREREKVDANTSNKEFQARLRRILLKDIAILYWHLPGNNDPTSLLYNYLNPGIPAEDIYESDLNPARTSWGEVLSGSGIFFTYSAKDGIKPLSGAAIQECCVRDPNLPENDESAEIFEVFLSSGLLVDRHTDFNLPDTVPIQFQRVTRDGWSGKNPFGISGTDSYDEFLGSKDNVRIAVIHADSNRDNLVRDPIWLPILSLVKYVDTDYSGKFYEMRWQTTPFQHYDLKRYDGEVKTYLPCSNSTPPCYLTGYRNAQGQELKFARDGSRRLTQLTSPNGSWLHISYGPSDHITEIDDSRGRIVHYGYDERNRLISVTYPSGEVYHYEYDSTQHLLTFGVSPDTTTAPRLLLRNEYENSRVTKQTFADGTAYTYRYTVTSDGSITKAKVHTPDGRVFNIDFLDGYSDSTVREQDAQPMSQKDQPASR